MEVRQSSSRLAPREFALNGVLGGVIGAGSYAMAASLGIASAVGLDRLVGLDPLWGLIAVVPLAAWLFCTRFRVIVLAPGALVTLLFLSVALTRMWNPLLQSWPLAQAEEFPPFSNVFPEVDAVIVLSSNLSGPNIRDSAGFTRIMASVPWMGRVPVILTKLPDEGAGGDALFAYVETLKPAAPVTAIPSGGSTAEEAANLRRVMGSYPLKLGVITTPIHSRRAVQTFSDAGFEAVAIVAPERHYDLSSLSTPTDRVRAFRDWLPELTASIWYQLRRLA